MRSAGSWTGSRPQFVVLSTRSGTPPSIAATVTASDSERPSRPNVRSRAIVRAEGALVRFAPRSFLFVRQRSDALDGHCADHPPNPAHRLAGPRQEMRGWHSPSDASDRRPGPRSATPLMRPQQSAPPIERPWQSAAGRKTRLLPLRAHDLARVQSVFAVPDRRESSRSAASCPIIDPHGRRDRARDSPSGSS